MLETPTVGFEVSENRVTGNIGLKTGHVDAKLQLCKKISRFHMSGARNHWKPRPDGSVPCRWPTVCDCYAS